jgi:hypothetical protein
MSDKPTKTTAGCFGPDILESDHMRGCSGREYQCTCGYDDAKDLVIKRLRAQFIADCTEQGYDEDEAREMLAEVESGNGE